MDEYRKFKDLVDMYFELRDEKMLEEIRKHIDVRKSIRRTFIKELDYEERYVEVFSIKDQIKIGTNILNRETHKKYSSYKAIWILIYTSDEAIKQILKNADNIALNDMMYEIKKVLGNNYSNSSTHFKPGSNKKFTNIGKKRAFKKLYKRCKKNIK